MLPETPRTENLAGSWAQDERLQSPVGEGEGGARGGRGGGTWCRFRVCSLAPALLGLQAEGSGAKPAPPTPLSLGSDAT